MSGNIIHEDGRIYREGDGVATIVSPYDPEFYLNIEEGIKPLVSALTRKGYLTMSSCAGHYAYSRGHIAIAFPDSDHCHRFANNLILSTDLHNSSIKFKVITDYDDMNEDNKINMINYLNSIYHRGYEDYYFIEISIGENTKSNIYSIWQMIKNVWHREQDKRSLEVAFNAMEPYGM